MDFKESSELIEPSKLIEPKEPSATPSATPSANPRIIPTIYTNQNKEAIKLRLLTYLNENHYCDTFGDIKYIIINTHGGFSFEELIINDNTEIITFANSSESLRTYIYTKEQLIEHYKLYIDDVLQNEYIKTQLTKLLTSNLIPGSILFTYIIAKYLIKNPDFKIKNNEFYNLIKDIKVKKNFFNLEQMVVKSYKKNHKGNKCDINNIIFDFFDKDIINEFIDIKLITKTNKIIRLNKELIDKLFLNNLTIRLDQLIDIFDSKNNKSYFILSCRGYDDDFIFYSFIEYLMNMYKKDSPTENYKHMLMELHPNIDTYIENFIKEFMPSNIKILLKIFNNQIKIEKIPKIIKIIIKDKLEPIIEDKIESLTNISILPTITKQKSRVDTTTCNITKLTFTDKNLEIEENTDNIVSKETIRYDKIIPREHKVSLPTRGRAKSPQPREHAVILQPRESAVILPTRGRAKSPQPRRREESSLPRMREESPQTREREESPQPREHAVSPQPRRREESPQTRVSPQTRESPPSRGRRRSILSAAAHQLKYLKYKNKYLKLKKMIYS